MLDVCLLGTGGMMPMPGRFLTAMLARVDGKMLLVDCGEGTQVTMKMLGWGFKAIDVICFTHFHADHISGLPGILLTIGNAGRTEPLTLIGPSGLEWVTEGLRRIAPELSFPIKYIEITEQNGSITIGKFQVSYQSIDHIVRCYAYRIDIKRRGKFDTQKAISAHVPKEIWSKLQKEDYVTFEGNNYTADMVLGQERRGISVSYCTDTRPVDQLIPFINGSNLFICEGMYGENEKKQKAIENKHMLFSEAARLALQGKVDKLWLTHFSPSVSEPEQFFENAHSIFSNTELGEDRKKITLFFPE